MRPLDTRAAGPQLASPRRRTPAGPSSLATSRVVRAGDRPVPRSAQPRPAWGARAVGSLVPRVTRSAFEKFGFSTATLITEWATIVGPDLARLTAPERVKWPRLAERAPDDEGTPGGARRREGAALYLRVDGPRALDVQYKSQLIMDRINAFFGWAAVGTVRIVQGPVQGAGPVPVGRRASPAGGPAPEVVTALADPALRDAFARLYDGVARRR